jgi:hypothetical protein
MGLEFREHAAQLCRRMPALAAAPGEEADFAASGIVTFAPEAMP